MPKSIKCTFDVDGKTTALEFNTAAIAVFEQQRLSQRLPPTSDSPAELGKPIDADVGLMLKRMLLETAGQLLIRSMEG